MWCLTDKASYRLCRQVSKTLGKKHPLPFGWRWLCVDLQGLKDQRNEGLNVGSFIQSFNHSIIQSLYSCQIKEKLPLPTATELVPKL